MKQLALTDGFPLLGDYNSEELDAVRAKKVEERDRRFGKGRGHHTQATPTNNSARMQGHFNFDAGMSSGGLMETRIGEVGMSRDGRFPSIPEAAAHMY